MWTNNDINDAGSDMDTSQDSGAGDDTEIVGCEWRTHVMYGYAKVAKTDFDPVRDLLPRVADRLRADPASLEYRWHDGDDEEEHWLPAGQPDRRWGLHMLTKEQVARLPTKLGMIDFGDPPPYSEPLDFIAGDPEGGNYFESAILSGALPHFEGVELGLHALRLFILDLAQSPRPDLHLPTVQDPSRWIDYLEHLVELLQSMIVDFADAARGETRGR